MAISLGTVPQGFNLQGNVPSSPLGVAQGNTLQGNNAFSPMSPAATAPSPKTTYINNKVKAQTKPAPVPVAPTPQTPSPPVNNTTYQFGANQPGYNSTGQQVNSPPPPLTGMQGYSGGATGTPGQNQGVYDPYNSPQYQQYLNQFVNSQLPGLTTPQIQAGVSTAEQTLANIQKQVASQTSSALNNPNLSDSALTGQSMAAAKQGSLNSAAVQPLLDLYKEQQGQAATAYGAPLNTANTEASYLAGIAKPTAISPGQSLILPNPATGGASTLGNVPSYSAVSNPISPSGITTFNQTTGQQNSGFGTTPPTLGGNNDLASQYMQNPLIAGYVQATINSNGDMSAAGVPSQYQAAVNTVLQSQTGGSYSPGNASINQSNLATQQATANELIAPARTATSHLSDLQTLANAVNYSNSPIASNVRNQFSNSILTDPNITTLKSAIGVVRSEVAKVLGGGTPTVASQAEAADALPDNLSPENIAGVIANVQNLMNQKITEYSNPANAASLPTGLQMPSSSSSTNKTIPAGLFKL